MADANGQFQNQSAAVGPEGLGTASFVTEQLDPLLQGHALGAVNTFWAKAGPTYHGSYHSRTLDYIIAPQSWLKATKWCRTLSTSAWRLQAHHHSKLWDHVPVAAGFAQEVVAEPYVTRKQPINREALSTMLQTGWKRAEYIAALETKIEEKSKRVEDAAGTEKMEETAAILVEATREAGQ